LRFKLDFFGPRARVAAFVVHVLLFIVLGVPASILITGEILIHANEWLVGEIEGSPIQNNGKQWWITGATLPVPGPRTPAIPLVSPSDDIEKYHRYLVELHAPVLIHKIGYRPEWDIPINIDFDGDNDPRNNRVHAAKLRALRPVVYGEVTAVTDDSYYLLYSIYHIRDYDHPVRQQLTSWSYHDSDNEGFMIRLDRKTMKVVQGEGWFHNRFFLATQGEASKGNEPVQGKIFLEDQTHPVVYVQHFGHGVRFAQPPALAALESSTKVMRYRAGGTPVNPGLDRRVETSVNYDLQSFDFWYRFAKGPLRPEDKGVFEGEITIGRGKAGNKLVVGRVIAGIDYKKSSWVRPKPPWSWDDGWDRVPVAVWHFFPSRAFALHFGTPLSDHYIFNRPISKIFNEDPNELQKHLSVKGQRRPGVKKWDHKKGTRHYNRDAYVRAVNIWMKKYVNRVFRSLG